MKNILTLLRLEFKNNFGDISSFKKKSIFKTVISLIFYALIVYIAFLGAQILFGMFKNAKIAYEGLVLLFAFLFLFLTISGISNTIKVLYYKGDNVILMRFPVNGTEIFVSKSLFLMINGLLTSAVVIVPLLISYSMVVPMPTHFYAMIPLVVVFMAVIPFLIANILAIPIMQITNKIRNKFGFIIIMLTILITAIFAVYMIMFNAAVNYLNDSNYSVFSQQTVDFLRGLCRFLLPAKYFADMLLQIDLFICIPVLIVTMGLLLIGAIIVIVKLYSHTLLKSVEVEGSAFTRMTKNKKRSIPMALLKKEFLQVFRSVNYSFQYLVLACSMPLMVYFCTNIASEIGKNNIGDRVATGIAVLVMLIFSVVITSFAATSVTREGHNFYHTKVMPVSIHKQLFIKFIMYLIVSFGANLLCVILLVSTRLLSITIGIWVLILIQALSVGMILRFMRLDVRKPYFSLSGDGEVVNNNPNTSSAIAFGFVVAIAVGSIAMLTAYLLSQTFMMIITSSIACIFTIYGLTVYLYKLSAAYNKITK